jgi:hypothetical protein
MNYYFEVNHFIFSNIQIQTAVQLFCNTVDTSAPSITLFGIMAISKEFALGVRCFVETQTFE